MVKNLVMGVEYRVDRKKRNYINVKPWNKKLYKEFNIFYFVSASQFLVL